MAVVNVNPKGVVGLHLLQRASGGHQSYRQTIKANRLFMVKEGIPSTLDQSPLAKAGGIVYRKSVFDKHELDAIRNDCNKFKKSLTPELGQSVATNRLGTALPRTCNTYDIFETGSLNQLVKRVAGEDYELSHHLPLEIRTYEKKGACMAWHADDVHYDPPQVEVVWCLENDSDCSTLYKIGEKVEEIQTEPNAVLLIEAGGPTHCVTSLKRGSRTILKCAFSKRHAKYLDNVGGEQFKSIGSDRSQRKSRRKGRARKS